MSTTPGIKLVCTHDGCEKRSVARRLCHAHYQAAWKAGELGQHVKLPPREKKNDHVCPDDHKHAAASTCFIQHQCRCTPCVEAHNARERNRSKQKAYGRFDTGLVDAGPVREHILKLGEFGIGYKRVAELAGVGTTGVRTLIWGRQDPGDRYGEIPKRVAREKAEKILAVQATIENLGARQSVPARATHRRVQALVARGWSLSKVARLLGWTVENFHTMMRRDMVGAATHREVAALYEELWDVAPPRETHRDKIAYTRSLNFAKQRRWLPPLAWDDIDTDEEPPVPDEEGAVDEVAIELAIAGEGVRLRPAERRECVRRLHAERWSDGRIAEAIRCTSKTVMRIREELGLGAFDQTELRARGAA
ncbi:hypothetical protein HF576_02045 [Microbacterium sp. CFH 90308]|uniref:Homeodomain-like domain-containing protein n=1 Tax=Microbacterium salsuginis TaxID=2722803 RepID=A0ABX1K6H8_9MICO|nr:hypothetical protein [Microbacterium sp. CFH 90308]NLP82621.1 hypothetical protein [Microbacterium sp. CFH 90308]